MNSLEGKWKLVKEKVNIQIWETAMMLLTAGYMD
jgi:hypothetical protein